MRTITLCLFAMLALAECSGGGHNQDASSLTSIAPTVEGACPSSTCPEPVDCHPFKNPEGGAISVDARWEARLDLCCGLRLCEVDGACYYGCPAQFVNPGCR